MRQGLLDNLCDKVFTIVGARGFVGSAVGEVLLRVGANVVRIQHNDPLPKNPGIVIYCSGVAWGADRDPDEAFRLHVDVPQRILESSKVERFAYLSSTRVYDGATTTDEDIVVPEPHESRDPYVRTKRAGEKMVLDDSRGYVMRLSNVFGASLRSELFLSDVLRQAAQSGSVAVRTSRASEKDYVDVVDVAELVAILAATGRERIYNIARGSNTTHDEIFSALENLGILIHVPADAPSSIASAISIERVKRDAPPPVSNVVDAIPNLYRTFVQALDRTS